MYNNLFHIFYNNLCDNDDFLPKKYILNDTFLLNLSKYKQVKRDSMLSNIIHNKKSCFDMCKDDLHDYIYKCYCEYKDKNNRNIYDTIDESTICMKIKS